jgi:hypothetical protein
MECGRNTSHVIIFILVLMQSVTIYADTREQQQARLDQACETARTQKLKPLRQQFVEDCVANEQQSDREACERLYAHYGDRSGSRPALFYDLPECVDAFEYQNSQRDPG